MDYKPHPEKFDFKRDIMCINRTTGRMLLSALTLITPQKRGQQIHKIINDAITLDWSDATHSLNVTYTPDLGGNNGTTTLHISELIDLYQGYRISDFGQLDDLVSSCRAMLNALSNAAYSDDDKSGDVILRGIEMNLPVPFEMLGQVNFKDYKAFLERTAQFVEPIIKLDRLYPDPIVFRLMW